jgi:hypothetical protein
VQVSRSQAGGTSPFSAFTRHLQVNVEDRPPQVLLEIPVRPPRVRRASVTDKPPLMGQ